MRTTRFGLVSSWIVALMLALVGGCGGQVPIGDGPDPYALIPTTLPIEGDCTTNPFHVITNERKGTQQALIGSYTEGLLTFSFRIKSVCGPMHLSTIGFKVDGTGKSDRWYATLDTAHQGTGGHFHLGDVQGKGIELVFDSRGNRQYWGRQSAPVEPMRYDLGPDIVQDSVVRVAANTQSNNSSDTLWLTLNWLELTRDVDGQSFIFTDKSPQLQDIWAITRLTWRLR